MESLNDLKSLGKLEQISTVINKLNPEEKLKEKDVYEITFFDNWLMIDFNIVTKNFQYVLTKNKNFINELKKFDEILLIEITMNDGLHVLVSFDSELKTSFIEKEVSIKNVIKTKLRIEFKRKCLIYPRMIIHKKNVVRTIDFFRFVDLLKSILKLIKTHELLNIKDFKINLDKEKDDQSDNEEYERAESDYSSDSEIDDDFKNMISKGTKKLKTDQNGNQKVSNQIFDQKILHKVYLNYKQHFKDSNNNEFIELQNNLDAFVKYLEKSRCTNIYFNDLVLFILSILYEEDYPSNKCHPFYYLSCTRKWIKWTSSYMNFKDMLQKNNASLSYRIDIKIDSHDLYRAVTRHNDIGSNLSERDSKIEFENFREKYKIKESFEPNLSMQFISFILTTLSILNLNLSVHFSINNYLKMNTTNFKAGVKLYVPLFKRFTSKYKMNIIKCFNRRYGKSASGYIYFKNLYWQSIYNNSDFFDNLLSSVFSSLTSNELDILKSEILLIGTGNNITLDLENVKKNFKKWIHTLPFLNCKILLRKNGSFQNSILNDAFQLQSCLFIDNYQLNDTITNDGVIDYDFPYQDFLTRGVNEGLFSLDNELRYSVFFTAIIKTIFGEDPLCGKLSVFSCIQFLTDLIVTASFFLKMKVLQMCLIQMGPPGCGKTLYLNIKQSVFSNLAKPINMSAHFNSSELNSSKSNSEETFLFFANEASRVDFSVFKSAISDLSFKSSTRNLFEQHDQDCNFSNASYIVNQNAEGITYFTKDIHVLDDAFVRRLCPIYFSSNIGGSDIRSSDKTYYKNHKGLSILSDLNPEFHYQTIGLLFYLLDLSEYFQIGNWDENNIIKPCYANLRRAVMGQYEPIKILRSENLIFLDEIYPDNSKQMLKFKMNDSGLILRQELNSTAKYQSNQLTSINIEIIAKCLKKLLNIDTRYCPKLNEWKIYGVKRYRECSELEIKASEQPHKDWFGFNKYFKEENVQDCLPSALRFYVHEKINYKFNTCINAIYKNVKIKFEQSPTCSSNFKAFTSKELLDRIKNFDIF